MSSQTMRNLETKNSTRLFLKVCQKEKSVTNFAWGAAWCQVPSRYSVTWQQHFTAWRDLRGMCEGKIRVLGKKWHLFWIKMDLQPPYWRVILAVLGLFQAALGDLLLNVAVIPVDLGTAAVPGPQPAVEHTAAPTPTAQWGISFCIKLYLQREPKGTGRWT